MISPIEKLTSKCKDNKQMAYYSTDEQMKRLGRVLLGPIGEDKDY